MRRHLPLFLVLLAAYAAMLGIGDTTGPEAHALLTAESLVSDQDLDLRDEYRGREWEAFSERPLRPSAPPQPDGRLHEPQGIGLPLLAAPAYALGGETGARLLFAALAALAFCLAAALGRRLVPEPWPTRAALVVGLSPPALGAATAIAPEVPGAVLAGGSLLFALRVRESPQTRPTAGCAALAAALPWLAAKLIVPAAVLAAALYRWLRRRRRGLAGFVALELVLLSAVVYVTVNGRLFGGLTPNEASLGAAPVTGASDTTEYLERWPRLAGLWIDQDIGLLRWAPVLGLAFVAAWLLWRSRRARLAAVVADQVDVEVTATACLLLSAALLASAVFLAPDDLGPWFPGEELVVALPPLTALSAWGWRFVPRAGAVLAAVTLAASGWLVVAGHTAGDARLRPPAGPLPWGGAQDVLPSV
ncbi:MAG TPA: hypothetical protein VD931_03500, partial [Baekduia sp.]|nr:hypothetical protein [Baekduia sp.]